MSTKNQFKNAYVFATKTGMKIVDKSSGVILNHIGSEEEVKSHADKKLGKGDQPKAKAVKAIDFITKQLGFVPKKTNSIENLEEQIAKFAAAAEKMVSATNGQSTPKVEETTVEETTVEETTVEETTVEETTVEETATKENK